MLDFDITSGGEIVYSNGKYLILIDHAGKELVLDTIELIGKVRGVVGTFCQRTEISGRDK